LAKCASTRPRPKELPHSWVSTPRALLQEVPYRDSFSPGLPTDSLIYRFYLVQVYGTTWKELIHEEFGEGIMSAIDFDMAIERQRDPKSDRVRISMSERFSLQALLKSGRVRDVPPVLADAEGIQQAGVGPQAGALSDQVELEFSQLLDAAGHLVL
jgi:hypothetical protein